MSDTLIGKVLGKYKIIERLGSGGMADVYRGLQVGLEREVAIKVLPPAFAQDREMVKRFRRESQATAKLSHPNIITIYDSGEQEGYYYYVMEYLKADSLEDVLEKESTLSIARTLKIAQDILKALVYTHDKDIIHRDLKPANIKFDLRENAIVTDFGLVKDLGETAITLSGCAMGTPQYMSPEQLKGSEVDARSDLYQVGVMVYEMLVGKTPIQVQPQQPSLTASKILGQAFESPAEINSEIPEELSEFVMKSLAQDTEERFQTAKDMLNELRRVELKQRAKKLSTRANPVIGPTPSVSVNLSNPSQSQSSIGSLSADSESVWASSISAILTSPKDRDALVKLLLVTVPTFFCGILAVLWFVLDTPLGVVEKYLEVEATKAVVSYKSNTPCFSLVEYWPISSPDERSRSKMLPILQAEHRHVLDQLRSDTTYHYRILLSHAQDDETALQESEVFDFRTRPEIQVFNIHAEEHPSRVIITWETNIRTDTTIRYGPRENELTEQRSNPEQTEETMHMITVENLTPQTLYFYQIIATDPQRRGATRITEVLTFTTPSDDDWNRRDSSLVNLTKSYVDKLTRMTPDEREKLKASIEKFTGPTGDITPEQKKELLSSETNPTQEDMFNNRLQQLRNWIEALRKQKKDVEQFNGLDQKLQKLYYTNVIMAARRLDSSFKKLAEMEK